MMKLASPTARPNAHPLRARALETARSFAADRGGNTAMIFALAALPIFYSTGAVVDYTRMLRVQAGLQEQMDGSALSVAAAYDTANYEKQVDNLKSVILAEYGDEGVTDVTVQGQWISGVDFQVTATATLKMYFMPALSDLAKTNVVAAKTVARTSTPTYVYKDPDLSQLDPEAGDYNRMGVYCYDATKSKEADKGRSEIVWIADNGGTKYTFTMPTCGKGETMSYMLKNVRSARTTKSKWDDPKAEQYYYYTDTKINLGVETYDLGGWQILETVLCDTKDACLKTKSKGGSIPFGKERTPEKATGMCQPGKYMYYGWEDRPPGNGWTDKDYDDIRVVIECPNVTSSGDKTVFLLR